MRESIRERRGGRGRETIEILDNPDTVNKYQNRFEAWRVIRRNRLREGEWKGLGGLGG